VKTVAIVGLLGILLVPILGMSATRISIGTGPWSGAYFPVGEASRRRGSSSRNIGPRWHFIREPSRTGGKRRC